MQMNEPAWLTAKIDQRVALVEQELARGRHSSANVVFVMLTEPPDDSEQEAARWERTCDNCGKDCTDSDFYTGHVIRELRDGRKVFIGFGVCPNHKV